MTNLPYWSDGAAHISGLYILVLAVGWVWFGWTITKQGGVFGVAFGLTWFVAIPYVLINGALL